MVQRNASQFLGAQVGVRHLVGHADGEGQVGEVDVAGAVITIEVDAGAAIAEVDIGVAQREQRVDGRP